MTRPGLAPAPEAGPCIICGVIGCKVIHSVQVPIGAPLPEPERTYTIPANIWREERLVFAAGEVIDYDRAVAEGFIEWEPMPDPPGRGKRRGERARRPSEDRMRRKREDRSKRKGGDR
jgi:hypothetical protein